MFSESAELYDRIYGRLKDYPAETRRIAELVSREISGAETILDVACGTGEHMRQLRDVHGFRVEGLDLDGDLVGIARSKNPGARIECADLRDFDLGTKYDVVTCLFSSIGYAKTPDGLRRALGCFHGHANKGGLVLVEPWFEPGALSPGRIFLDTVESDDVTVVRMACTEVTGGTSTTRFEYLVGCSGRIEHRSEVHELGLFTKDEMLSAFADAGMQVTFEDEGLTGRGLYVARA